MFLQLIKRVVDYAIGIKYIPGATTGAMLIFMAGLDVLWKFVL